MTNSSEKHWYLVQWHKTDENRARLVNKALFDGYFIADRLLEGCMFVVSVTSDGKLSVEADYETRIYIEGMKASVSEWNTEVLEELEKHQADNLNAYSKESSWLDFEVNLTDDLSWFSDNGILVESYHTYPE